MFLAGLDPASKEFVTLQCFSSHSLVLLSSSGMGLVTLFRGPRFLVSLYFQAQGSKLFRPVVYFSIPVIGRSFGKR